MLLPIPPASLVNLNHSGTYLHWGIIQISLANALIILAMLVVFALALVLPFPLDTLQPPKDKLVRNDDTGLASRMWTTRARHVWLRVLPPEHMLPDGQPSYVATWAYIFGVATVASLMVVVASGFAIAIGGLNWWHDNAVGHFANSLHLWSVELFFAFMVVHLWMKFFMGAWRGGRQLTWMTGATAFLLSVPTAGTGYLTQQSFDAQWIAVQHKTAFDAIGLGGVFQLMNFGQMITWHIVLLPMLIAAALGVHLFLVRVRGVVPPYSPRCTAAGGLDTAREPAQARPQGQKETR